MGFRLVAPRHRAIGVQVQDDVVELCDGVAVGTHAPVDGERDDGMAAGDGR